MADNRGPGVDTSEADRALLESQKHPLDSVAGHRFLCEVCGLEVILTDAMAYELGWDYPPFMGAWGVISPRTCGGCTIDKTAWWWLTQNGTGAIDDMPENHIRTVQRILAERKRS